MNILTIFYQRRDPGKFFELMRKMATSELRQEWDNENSTYKIIWEWAQKEAVLNLLSFLKETFLDAQISIDNDVEEAATVEVEHTVKIQDVQKEDILETTENESENVDEAMIPNKSKDEEIIIAKEEENTSEDVNHVEEESSAICELSKAPEEDVVEEIPEEVVEIPETTEEPKVNETLVIPEEMEDNKIAPMEEEVIHEEEVAEEKAKVIYDPNEELQKIFAPYFEKYDFTNKFSDSAEKFCMDQGIKNEAFCRFFALSKTAPSLEKLYAGVTRITKHNSALVKIDIKKNFEKFLKSIEPEIFDKCPEITVVHFLNIFREENRKF